MLVAILAERYFTHIVLLPLSFFLVKIIKFLETMQSWYNYNCIPFL